MKKRLNRSDIDQLTPEERIPLRKLPGPWRCDDIPLMSIGDMIEYLGNAWVDAEAVVDPKYIPPGIVANKDLCDALWSAVKEKAALEM